MNCRQIWDWLSFGKGRFEDRFLIPVVMSVCSSHLMPCPCRKGHIRKMPTCTTCVPTHHQTTQYDYMAELVVYFAPCPLLLFFISCYCQLICWPPFAHAFSMHFWILCLDSASFSKLALSFSTCLSVLWTCIAPTSKVFLSTSSTTTGHPYWNTHSWRSLSHPLSK